MLLQDAELLRRLTATPPLVEGFPSPYDGPINPDDPMWRSDGSPVQPSSIDLHIGGIYLPGMEDLSARPVADPNQPHVLQRGELALVVTRERLHLARRHRVGALATIPTDLTSLGLLATNPGHVDPGYCGKLRIILINMGNRPVPLRVNDICLTLLFYAMTEPASRGYPYQPQVDVKPSSLSWLAPDFLDFANRAKEIAQERAEAVSREKLDEAIARQEKTNQRLEHAEKKLKGAKIWSTAVGALLVALLAASDSLVNYLRGYGPDIRQLESDVDRIDELIQAKPKAVRLEQMEQAIEEINQRLGQ